MGALQSNLLQKLKAVVKDGSLPMLGTRPDHSCPPSSLLSPKRGAGAGVGESVCWGKVGFHQLKIKKCLGILDSWFQSFKDSRNYFHISDPILPKNNFMLSGRDCSHIQYFRKFIRRVGIFWPPSFPTFLKNKRFWFMRYLRIIFC